MSSEAGIRTLRSRFLRPECLPVSPLRQFGGHIKIRTLNLLVRSQSLFHLSYMSISHADAVSQPVRIDQPHFTAYTATSARRVTQIRTGELLLPRQARTAKLLHYPINKKASQLREAYSVLKIAINYRPVFESFRWLGRSCCLFMGPNI